MARTVPVMASEVPGNYQASALWNSNVKALGDFLLNKPFFSAYATTAQSIPTGAFTPLNVDTEVSDFDAGHNPAVNPSRYTCQVAGQYLLTGEAVFPINGTGVRGAMFALNGATTTGIVGSEQLIAPSTTFATTVAPTPSYVRLAVGDFVSICGYQNTGSALNTTTVGAAMSSFSVEWITA